MQSSGLISTYSNTLCISDPNKAGAGTHLQLAKCNSANSNPYTTNDQQWTVNDNNYVTLDGTQICMDNTNGSTDKGNPITVQNCAVPGASTEPAINQYFTSGAKRQ